MSTNDTERDAAMLDSLSDWFRLRGRGVKHLPHSFNDYDVSELMDRMVERLKDPRTHLRVVK